MLKHLALLLLPINLFAQITSYNAAQTGVGNAEVYMPAGGSTHAILFFTGRGEWGADKSKIYVNGPMPFIASGKFIPRVIVIGCQSPIESPSASVAQRFVAWAINQFNLQSVSITGLSYGAQNVFEYMRTTTGMQPYAIVPMSYSESDPPSAWYRSTKVRGFCGKSDSFFAKMKSFFDKLIAAGYSATFTAYTGGHSGWQSFYDPNYKGVDGKTIYDFMTPPVTSDLIVDAGPDQDLYFPSDTVALTLASPLPVGASLTWSIVSVGMDLDNNVLKPYKTKITVRATVTYNGKTYVDDKIITPIIDKSRLFTTFGVGETSMGVFLDGLIKALPTKGL